MSLVHYQDEIWKDLEKESLDNALPPCQMKIGTIKGGSRHAKKSHEVLMMMKAAQLGWAGARAGKKQEQGRSRVGVGRKVSKSRAEVGEGPGAGAGQTGRSWAEDEQGWSKTGVGAGQAQMRTKAAGGARWEQ